MPQSQLSSPDRRCWRLADPQTPLSCCNALTRFSQVRRRFLTTWASASSKRPSVLKRARPSSALSLWILLSPTLGLAWDWCARTYHAALSSRQSALAHSNIHGHRGQAFGADDHQACPFSAPVRVFLVRARWALCGREVHCRACEWAGTHTRTADEHGGMLGHQIAELVVQRVMRRAAPTRGGQ
jgi:hypothetical protein